MKEKYLIILLIIGIIITFVGIVTGKFFFLLLIIPLGFGVFKRKSKGN